MSPSLALPFISHLTVYAHTSLVSTAPVVGLLLRPPRRHLELGRTLLTLSHTGWFHRSRFGRRLSLDRHFRGVDLFVPFPCTHPRPSQPGPCCPSRVSSSFAPRRIHRTFFLLSLIYAPQSHWILWNPSRPLHPPPAPSNRSGNLDHRIRLK